MSSTEHRPKKRQRRSRACDFCHRRSIRCCPSATQLDSCQNCIDFDIPCRYDRPIKRGRGRDAAAGEQSLEPTLQPVPTIESGQILPADSSTIGPTGLPDRDNPQLPNHEQQRPPTVAPDPSWRSFAAVSKPQIMSLLNAYFQVVYPIFPFFEQQLFLEELDRDTHTVDRDFLATIMATCALVAGRIRDGSNSDGSVADVHLIEIPVKVFQAASEDCLPSDIAKVTTLNALRVYPLLALSAIQERHINIMHKYIGLYFTILSIRSWHDETNWPSSWTVREREEMRILYWSTYTLDVYSAIVWNGCIHFQESHSRVQYPSPQTDSNGQSREPSSLNWMVGWNFTTDLYRVLEHAISRFRTQSSQFNILRMSSLASPRFSSDLNARVDDLYSAIPETFKTIEEMTGDTSRDIYSFQAANIQATLALLRMVLFSVEANSDVDKKCSVASDLLALFHRIPKSYLRAISAPLIYHLSGIGQILGSVFTSPISEVSYSKIRELLFSMAALLECLESVLQKRADAARSLLDQVDRIDQFMARQRQSTISNQNYPQTHVANGSGTDPPGVGQGFLEYHLPDDIVGDWTWPIDYNDTASFAVFDWFNNAPHG